MNTQKQIPSFYRHWLKWIKPNSILTVKTLCRYWWPRVRTLPSRVADQAAENQTVGRIGRSCPSCRNSGSTRPLIKDRVYRKERGWLPKWSEKKQWKSNFKSHYLNNQRKKIQKKKKKKKKKQRTLQHVKLKSQKFCWIFLTFYKNGWIAQNIKWFKLVPDQKVKNSKHLRTRW